MRKLTPDLTDFAGVLGLGLVSYGVWKIYPPAAFIVVGTLIIVAAVAMARR
ncbi:hypothetical protein [Neorhizobium galegae]|uniref:hypothetical protein n=1 Tax=Neorhizobium galegae TaxID=399 RepID=UPI001F3622A4|nr:hypothetical protein [Neorhizobium galegae]UIK04897.1 hypothetical protein LZK81_19920 [Neorhizobium galegae]